MNNADHRHPPSNIRRMLSVRNRLARAALWLAGVTPLLAKRPSNALPYSALEMLRLFVDLRRRRPGTVMEFGVGASTIAMALALHKNNYGRLITVDASEEWIAVCRDSLPEHLRKCVEFVHSPVEPTADEKGHRYTRRPDAVVDYLFIDGPAVQHVPGWDGPAIAADPVMPDMTFSERARIMVEGRTANVEFLQERLDPSWKMKKDRLLVFSWTIFDKHS
jgi:hypothetical protein